MKKTISLIATLLLLSSFLTIFSEENHTSDSIIDVDKLQKEQEDLQKKVADETDKTKKEELQKQLSEKETELSEIYFVLKKKRKQQTTK